MIMLKMITHAASLSAEIAKRKAAGKTVALVPTMGALHEGHLSLVRLAKKQADVVVVSIFVNPTQFAPHEDLESYPRPIERDKELLEREGVEILYHPSVEEMYPNGQQIEVKADEALASVLDGEHRPTHFDGVTTIVSRLFAQCQPDIAIFGQKDYQQLQIIRQMVAEHELPVEVIGAPIMRESSGLAMSSRNQYLNSCQKKVAAQLQFILQQTAKRVKAADAQALEAATEAILAAGFTSVDYVALVDARSLQPIAAAHYSSDSPARLLAAATLGTTRLIDNIAIESVESADE